MVIRLAIEDPDPPLGTVSVEGRDPVAFEGWLGLLGVLSSLMSEREDRTVRPNRTEVT